MVPVDDGASSKVSSNVSLLLMQGWLCGMCSPCVVC